MPLRSCEPFCGHWLPLDRRGLSLASVNACGELRRTSGLHNCPHEPTPARRWRWRHGAAAARDAPHAAAAPGLRRTATAVCERIGRGAEVAVSLTFDVDAESGWLGTDPAYARRLSTLSEGRFGVTRGLPRILEILAARDQGHVLRARRHRRTPHGSDEGGHGAPATRSATTGTCTSRATRSRRTSRRRRSSKGIAALQDRLGVTPRGYRRPSWELTPETLALLKHTGSRTTAA